MTTNTNPQAELLIASKELLEIVEALLPPQERIFVVRKAIERVEAAYRAANEPRAPQTSSDEIEWDLQRHKERMDAEDRELERRGY